MIGGLVHPDHLVAFDLETTGLSPRSDRILEIGAVRYDRALRPIDELQVVVDPQMPHGQCAPQPSPELVARTTVPIRIISGGWTAPISRWTIPRDPYSRTTASTAR